MTKEIFLKISPKIILNKIVFSKDFSEFITLISETEKNIVIVTDSNVEKLIAKNLQASMQEKGFSLSIVVIPPGDMSKNREIKKMVEDKMFSQKYLRDTCLIAIGGGTVLDIAGFVAATYCRGISFVSIPTTLLAMVDAAIGGKTAINTSYGKNLIGAFYFPKLTYINTNYLQSLPKKEITNGLAEIIKYGITIAPKIFDKCYKNPQKLLSLDDMLEKIILECIKIKKNIVEEDPYEKNIRKILNFGHTIGHAIETLSNHTISHGEAIAIGMIVESYISYLENYLSNEDFQRIFSLFKKHPFSLQLPKNISPQRLIDLLRFDKKNMNREIHFVPIKGIGKIALPRKNPSCAIDKKTVQKALVWMEQNFVGQLS